MGGHLHVIVWEFDMDCVVQHVECRAAEDADCRLYCDEDCESWSKPVRREDGTIWHSADDTEPWHRMVAMTGGDCNVALFLNEGGCIPEDAEQSVGRFVLAETPIKPVWTGDTYMWGRAAS